MRVVILGTGTNVGKTYVSRRLAACLQGSADVVALKPIESGVHAAQAGDAELIAQAAGHAPRMSPWRFSRPVSPHAAAREAGRELHLAELVEWIGDQEAAWAGGQLTPGRPRITIIETAGGAFSPLAKALTNADLAQALEPAVWLLVAADALGTLHDVTACLRALPRAPDGVVMCAARSPDASTGTNAGELRSLGIVDPLAELSAGATDASALAEWLLRLDG
jgi:dethiobiotin synthetase